MTAIKITTTTTTATTTTTSTTATATTTNNEIGYLTATHKSLLAGGIAGSLGKTVTAPLSRLTILYQVSPILSLSSATTSSYNGSMYHTCKQIILNEGYLSFWKGNLTSVLHRFPYSAINFTSYEITKDFIVNNYNKKQETPLIRFICGSIAGGVACIVCYPLDLIRTRLTVQHTNSSILNSLMHVVKEESITGLYRGVGISLLVSVPNLGIGFSVYGSMKEHILLLQSSNSINAYPIHTFLRNYRNNEYQLSSLGSMVCGAVSGILSSLIIFPADVIRRRMQVSGLIIPSTSINKIMPMNAWKECIAITRSEGLLGMYRGILPELLKVTPMVAITFSMYEFMMKVMK